MADIQALLHLEGLEASIAPEIEAYEIVDGQVHLTVGATDPPQHVIMQFGHEMAGWGSAHDTEILHRPFDVRTTPARQRQPDLLVVLAEHRDGIGHAGMEGAPDLGAGVLSPSIPAVDVWRFAVLDGLEDALDRIVPSREP